MKILLISPASGKWRSIGRQRIFNGKTFRFSMLSLLTVARLCPDNAQVRLIDEQIDDIPYDEHFDVVGITCMTAPAPRAFALCDYFRKRRIPVVLGGFFASLNPDLALEHCDAVVIGPALEAWPRLLDDLKSGRLGRKYHGNPAGQVPAKLPEHVLNRESYSTTNATYATMGCRNRCKFCSISAVYDSQHHHRAVAEVIREYYSPRRLLRRALRWLRSPGGLRNFIYPLMLNCAYLGRVRVFGIRGYDPARRAPERRSVHRLRTAAL